MGDYDGSDSESSDHGPTGDKRTKRRRLHGACDTCRRKKIKCDSAIMPESICTNCLNSKGQCTHNVPRQKKKDTQQEYIRTLEERLRKMEEATCLSPGSRSSKSTSPPCESLRGSSPSNHDLSVYPELLLPVPRQIPDVIADSSSSMVDPDDVDDLDHVVLTQRFRAFSMESVDNRFFGKSSMFAFAEQARAARREYGEIPPHSFSRIKRPYFWDIRPWEKDHVSRPRQVAYVYPEPDLLESLTKLYFDRVHIIFPIVHRQSYERALWRQEHLTNPQFGMVVLGICSVAARHSDDPRVFLKETDGESVEGSSAGWKWISQVPIWRDSLCDRTTLYDMEFFGLASFYFIGSAMPQISFNVTGLALRLAVEKGLHRRRGPDYKPTIEEEAERRAFWCLVTIDRIQSSFLGRPCALHDEDIDCDYPVECDDEFWENEDPSKAFKQPPGLPSYASSFTFSLKLCEIIGFMLRTLYSTKKSKILTGLVGDDWETRVVSELDSSLNKWRDSLPTHLVWDPLNPSDKFYYQSLYLYSTYYYVQIQVHRPFLRRNSPLALSALAICANAARACGRTIDKSMKRGLFCFPNIMMAGFISAMVLTVNFWSSKQSHIAYDPLKEMSDIEGIRAFLALAEKRWYIGGRFRDMITEFIVMRPAPWDGQTEPAPAPNKRSRPEETSIPSGEQSFPVAHVQTHSIISSIPMSNFSQYVPEASVPLTFPAFQQPGIQPGKNYHQLPATMHASNEWDLNSLLLAQMGYDQLPGNNFIPVPNLPRPANDLMNIVDAFPATIPQNNYVYASSVDMGDGNQGSGYGENMFDMSMWMSAPQSFSLEEWDTFIAAMAPG